MGRKTLTRLPAGRGHLELLPLEGRRHGAADQGPGSERARALPYAARYHALGQLADREVAAQPQVMDAPAVLAQRQLERRAGIVVPDLVGIDHAVPVRALAGPQQEIDR